VLANFDDAEVTSCDAIYWILNCLHFIPDLFVFFKDDRNYLNMENSLTYIYLEIPSRQSNKIMFFYVLLDSQLSQYIRTDADAYKDRHFCRYVTII